MIRQNDETGSSFTRVFQIKGSHIILTLIGWLVMTVVWLTGIHADADESKRRIRDLETRPVVTEQEYRDSQEMLKAQLRRIEDKVDMLDNLNKIEQMQRPRPRR
jgi:hypothetical protein